VTDEAATVALVARVVRRFKRIDVLFNNAGISGVGDVLETEPTLFDNVMRVNVRGVYLMCRAVVPLMIKQRSGSIINMSSAIAEIGLARRVSYAASKGAVLAMTRSMQVDVAPHGIRVNAAFPEPSSLRSWSATSGSRTPTPRRDTPLSANVSSAAGWASRRTSHSPRCRLGFRTSHFVMASGLIVDGE
jgi:NAD(P)-dependent dehydrogenase (short-subunit alcohol dehydrogenase family)